MSSPKQKVLDFIDEVMEDSNMDYEDRQEFLEDLLDAIDEKTMDDGEGDDDTEDDE